MVDDADRMVARAIESVLDQVPGAVDTSLPDMTSAKLQPWAETAAPVGRNKRPLEELLVELEQRVAADPQARATLPRMRHPALAFFDRFGRAAGQPAAGAPAAEGGGRRRRRRRGGGGGQAGAPVQATTAPAASPADRSQGGRRRSRRGRGGGGASERVAGPAPSGQDNATAGGQPRGSGSSGRRRRGRRGRGGDRQSAG